MPQLTENELRALAYYAIGVASEGKDEAYRLSFAGHVSREKDGATELKPIGNSGYSIGEMQTDLGQHHDAAAGLVAGFQAWAHVHHSTWELDANVQATLTSELGRDGHHIRDSDYKVDSARHIAIRETGTGIDTKDHPNIKAHLDAYLASDTGKAFVDAQDLKRVEGMMANVAAPLQKLNLYKHASLDEQARLFAVIAKVYNQNPGFARETLGEIAADKITSLAEISAKIDTFPDGLSHYMRTGRDAALGGADVFMALQATGKDHPLHGAWQAAVANPVMDAAQQIGPLHAALADQHAAIKALFVQPAQGQGFIEALHTHGSYDYGDPAHAQSRGFYAQGQDFLLWDRYGQGSGLVDGQWIAFSRGEVALHHNDDHTLDVDRVRAMHTERWLHVTRPTYSHRAAETHQATAAVLHDGGRGEAVTALQTELSRLGYKNRDGHALRADGDFGTQTLLAVEAFQRDQGLAADGKAGPKTQRAIDAATYVACEQAVALGEPQAPLQALSDPSHPQHAMYAALQKWLPQGTSDARLAQATTACHLARIRKPEEVSGIYSGGDGKIFFTTNSLFARMATMDISKPAPAAQQSVQRVQQYDQQHQQRQVQARPAQMQQPMGQLDAALLP